MEDKAYINSTDNFLLEEPEEQKNERAREIMELADIAPKLKAIITAYDERIACQSGPASLTIDFTKDINGLERQAYALQESIKYLKADKEWFVSLMQTIKDL